MKNFIVDGSNNSISFTSILMLIKNKWLSICGWGLFMGLLAYVLSAFVIAPQYSSTIDLLVNQTSSSSDEQYTAQQADLQAINTYKDVLQKSVVLGPVVKQAKTHSNYSGNVSSLKNNLSIDNETDSQVISITVKDDNPYMAAELSNMIGSVFDKKIRKMMKVDNVSIVSKAQANPKPVSPNKGVNTIIGGCLGIVIGIIFALGKALMSKKIKGNSFIIQNMGLVNLGTVFHMDNFEKDIGFVKVKDPKYVKNSRRV